MPINMASHNTELEPAIKAMSPQCRDVIGQVWNVAFYFDKNEAEHKLCFVQMVWKWATVNTAWKVALPIDTFYFESLYPLGIYISLLINLTNR